MIKRFWILGILAVLISTAVLGAYIYHWEHRIPALEIDFLSLKRGRAVFIRTPENKIILYGGGQTSEIIRKLTTRMPFYRRKLDYVVIPSAVPAQIGGLVEILDRYQIGEIIIPKLLATSTALSAITSEIKKNKIKTHEVERGDVVEMGNGLKLNILFPYSIYQFNKTSLPELAASISYGSTSAYFLGNLSKTTQRDILKNTLIASTTNILEYYNSNGKSRNSTELLQAINPIFTFTTKQKTAHAVSLGQSWKMD